MSEGVHYVQIDAPRYSYYIDPKWRDYIKNDMGLDPDAALDEAIRVDNACLEGAKRDGVILAIHLCRGNNRSQWYAEGGYDAIAEKLFGAAPRRCLSARVRVGTGRHVRAFTLRAARQDGGAGAGEQQTSRARVARPTQEAHRRGEQVRAAGESRHQSAVRLRLHDGRAICSLKTNNGASSRWLWILQPRCGGRRNPSRAGEPFWRMSQYKRVIICAFNPFHSFENDKAQSIPLFQSFFFFCAKPVVGLLNPVIRLFVCLRIIVSKKILISICAILPDVFCVY